MRDRLTADLHSNRLSLEALGSSGPAVSTLRAALQPAGEQIAGDWYDTVALSPTRMGLVLGDVAGHGPGSSPPRSSPSSTPTPGTPPGSPVVPDRGSTCRWCRCSPDAQERQFMDEPLWQQRAPRRGGRSALLWTGEPASLAALSRMRAGLRSAVRAAALDRRPCGPDDAALDDGLERLLLVFEELVSNGLRHGRAPIRVALRATEAGWLLTVADGAGAVPPVPAAGRDAATGGHGLYMAARLATAHGWTRDGAAKTVWAVIEPAAVPVGAR